LIEGIRGTVRIRKKDYQECYLQPRIILFQHCRLKSPETFRPPGFIDIGGTASEPGKGVRQGLYSKAASTTTTEETNMNQRQKDMEESFLRTHREFVDNLKESINIIESDLGEAGEMQEICTDEWCKATETYLDELGKSIYSISEPRFATEADSQKIKDLRRRVHDLYATYKAASNK